MLINVSFMVLDCAETLNKAKSIQPDFLFRVKFDIRSSFVDSFSQMDMLEQLEFGALSNQVSCRISLPAIRMSNQVWFEWLARFLKVIKIMRFITQQSNEPP